MLIVFVILTHGFIRISHMPHVKLQGQMAVKIWSAPLNLAAGKGFTDDNSYGNSPELESFMNNISTDKRSEDNLLKLDDTFKNFTDYTVKNQYVVFNDSLGYRYLTGLVWKYFGFNWYYAGLLHYGFSLLALLSLVFCSYKFCGKSCSIFTGIIYSLSMTETFYVYNLGRDGIPLWFSCYLICSLSLLFGKPLTIRRIITFSILNGFLIFSSVQGRNSTIFFIPITIFIYFIMLFFTKCQIKYYNNYFSTELRNKIFYFFSSTITTVLFFVLLQKLFLSSIPTPQEISNSMHVVFIGLGIWAAQVNHPSQFLYSDHYAFYHGCAYSMRNFNILPTVLGTDYGIALFYYYIDFIKTYPSFWHNKVFLQSLNVSFWDLANPYHFYLLKDISSSLPVFLRDIFSQIVFYTTFLGSIILFFKKNLRFLLKILLIIILSTILMSFLQYNPRHILTAHSSYYFLSGVALGKVFCIIYKILFDKNYYIKNEVFKLKEGLLSLFEYFRPHYIKRWLLIILILLITIFLHINFVKYLEKKEENNIIEMISYFDSLEKHKLNIDTTTDSLKLVLPTETKGKNIGIYCPVKQTDIPQEITFSMQHYKRTFEIKAGESSTAFMPFYNGSFNGVTETLILKNSKICDGIYWSDLSQWRGALWEGTWPQTRLLHEIK